MGEGAEARRPGPFSALGLLDRLAPRRGITVSTGIAYGHHSRQKLDLYCPDGVQSAPVVVFFYGGGWEDGERGLYRFIGAALARAGFVAIVPDYRIYPEVRFPAFVEDGAAATAWAVSNAEAAGGDTSRLFLMGHSAGAHIAAMLATDRRYLGHCGLEPGQTIAGIIGLAGPYDFLPLHSETLKSIFGPPETLEQSQPIAFVEGGEPPALLISGTADRTVDPGNSSRLAARLRAKGGRAELRLYPRIGHALLIGTVAAPLRFLAPTYRDIVRFIRQGGRAA